MPNSCVASWPSCYQILVSALLKTLPVYTLGPTLSVCSLPASIWVSVCSASFAQDLWYCLYSANSTGLTTVLSTSCQVLHFPALWFYQCTSSLPARRHFLGYVISLGRMEMVRGCALGELCTNTHFGSIHLNYELEGLVRLIEDRGWIESWPLWTRPPLQVYIRRAKG